MRQLTDCQLADWTARGPVKSLTCQLADWSNRCYISVRILQIIKHSAYFTPLPCTHEVDDAGDETQQNVVSFAVR